MASRVILPSILWPLGPPWAMLADQEVVQSAVGVAVEDGQFVVAVLGQPFDLLAFDGKRALILVDAMAIEHAHLDDGA